MQAESAFGLVWAAAGRRRGLAPGVSGVCKDGGKRGAAAGLRLWARRQSPALDGIGNCCLSARERHGRPANLSGASIHVGGSLHRPPAAPPPISHPTWGAAHHCGGPRWLGGGGMAREWVSGGLARPTRGLLCSQKSRGQRDERVGISARAIDGRRRGASSASRRPTQVDRVWLARKVNYTI